MNSSYSKYLTNKNKNTVSQNAIQPTVAALWSPSSSVNFAPNTVIQYVPPLPIVPGNQGTTGNQGSTGIIDPTGTLTGSIIPSGDLTFNIGSATNRIHTLYADQIFVGPNTIHLGDAEIHAVDNTINLPLLSTMGGMPIGSIKIVGHVDTYNDLPLVDPTIKIEDNQIIIIIGDGYVTLDGHLWVASQANITNRTDWKDIGEIRGPAGTQGLAGTQGPAGKGNTGSQGTTGIQGPIGLQGIQGPIGLQGIQGLIGLQGLKGDYGGPQGSTGSTGPKGAQGDKNGAQGSIGSTGPKGAQGTTGTTGPKGPQGSTGAQGAVGTFNSTNIPMSGLILNSNQNYLLMSSNQVYTNQSIYYDSTLSTKALRYQGDIQTLFANFLVLNSRLTCNTYECLSGTVKGNFNVTRVLISESQIQLRGQIKVIQDGTTTIVDPFPTVPITMQTNASNTGGIILQTLGSSANIAINTAIGSSSNFSINPQGINSLTIDSTGAVNMAGPLNIKGAFNWNVGSQISATTTLITPLSQFYSITAASIVTITLPIPSLSLKGTYIVFKRTSGSGNITFSSVGNVFIGINTITLSSSLILSFGVNLICNGTNWCQI
jgi:hypothetical protein